MLISILSPKHLRQVTLSEEEMLSQVVAVEDGVCVCCVVCAVYYLPAHYCDPFQGKRDSFNTSAMMAKPGFEHRVHHSQSIML